MTVLLLLLALASQSDQQRWDFERRLGLVRVGAEDGCLAINAQGLTEGNQIFAVGLDERPVRTFTAQVESQVESCPGLPGFGAAYRVTFPAGMPAATIIGAATGVFRTIAHPGGRIAFRLLPAPTPHLLQFVSCSVSGALRVAVISDQPSTETEVWSIRVPNVAGDVPRCKP